MGRALLDADRPAMWRIEGEASDRRFVCLGGQRVAIADITSMSLEEVREHLAAGLFMKGTFFMLCSAGLAFYVFEAQGRERFLIGSAFLGWLALTALVEAFSLGFNSHFELTLTLHDGSTTVFSSHDRADIQALALRLASEGAAHI